MTYYWRPVRRNCDPDVSLVQCDYLVQRKTRHCPKKGWRMLALTQFKCFRHRKDLIRSSSLRVTFNVESACVITSRFGNNFKSILDATCDCKNIGLLIFFRQNTFNSILCKIRSWSTKAFAGVNGRHHVDVAVWFFSPRLLLKKYRSATYDPAQKLCKEGNNEPVHYSSIVPFMQHLRQGVRLRRARLCTQQPGHTAVQARDDRLAEGRVPGGHPGHPRRRCPAVRYVRHRRTTRAPPQNGLRLRWHPGQRYYR